MKKYILINKLSGTYDVNNPINENDLLELASGGAQGALPIKEIADTLYTLSADDANYWLVFTAQENVQINFPSIPLPVGLEFQGSAPKDYYLYYSEANLTVRQPYWGDNQFLQSGVFGFKILSSTEGQAFGTLETGFY